MDWCLHHLAEVAYARGDYEATQKLLAESREVPNSSNHSAALNLLARVAQLQGDWERATALCRESLAITRERGVPRDIARSLDLLGRGEIHRGNLPAARSLLEESLALYRAAGRPRGVAECLESLAGLAAAAGQPEQAARSLGAAEALREAIGTPLPPSERPAYERTLRASRCGCSGEGFAAAWVAGRALTLEQAMEYALTAPQSLEDQPIIQG
jgi:non-specific serine/threonine protein kinase